MAQNVNDPTDVFQECIRPFFSENINKCLQGKENPLFIKIDDLWMVNEKNRFVIEQPHIMWSLKRVLELFLKQWQSWGCFNCRDIINIIRMRQDIQRELERLLESTLNCHLIDIVTAISAERYESREASHSFLSVFPESMTIEALEKVGLVLVDPLMWMPFAYDTVHALRKQLNPATEDSLAICFVNKDMQTWLERRFPKEEEAWNFEDSGEPRFLQLGSYYAVGFAKRELRRKFYQFVFEGHMQWKLCAPFPEGEGKEETCIIRSRQGRLFFPLIDQRPYESLTVKRTFPNNKDAEDVIPIFLVNVRKQLRHGAMIIIAGKTDIEKELKRLCRDWNRGYLLEKPFDIVKEIQYVDRYAKVDGAIFMDSSGKCYAYGVMVDGEAKKCGDLSRGARHNSAYNYLMNRKIVDNMKMLAFLQSEDGMTELVSTEDV